MKGGLTQRAETRVGQQRSEPMPLMGLSQDHPRRKGRGGQKGGEFLQYRGSTTNLVRTGSRPMSMVAPLDRLASASLVFFGQHGDVSRHASEQGVSRQRLYRQAQGVVRDLDPSPHQQQLARLQQQVLDLQKRLDELQAQQP